MNSLIIRMATPDDAERLRDIYAPYVLDTAITFEYKVPSQEEFTLRISHILERYPYLVAAQGDTLVGYAYASAFHERAAYDWDAQTSIYVAQDARGGGVGKRLYHTLENILFKQNILNLYACISYPNPASIAFHERLGYRKIGHFPRSGYKLGAWWDMIWMEKSIGAHTLNPKPVIPISKINIEIY